MVVSVNNVEQGALDASAAKQPATVLAIHGLWKRFGAKDVLCGVELDVRREEVLTILGASGCGKSVLLKLIVGLIPPDAGEILFDGAHVEEMNNKALTAARKHIGMVFQGAALFDSLSVGENVAYGLREHYSRTMSRREIDARVSWALSSVGLPDAEGLMPAELSGGMRKRVGVARAIALRPELILYDEPTTGLDPTNSARVGQLILSLRREMHASSVIVTHDLALAFEVSDRIAFIHQGRIAQIGSVKEIRASEIPAVRDFLAARAEGDIPVQRHGAAESERR